MSKISTAIDYYVSQMATLFPNKTRVPNPYSLPDNNSLFLRDGYGIKVEGVALDRQDYKHFSEAYDIGLIFCRELLRVDSNYTNFDTAVKNLMEDHFTAREFFYDTDNMNSTIDRIQLGGTGPVSFLLAGNAHYLFIETSISTTIREVF